MNDPHLSSNSLDLREGEDVNFEMQVYVATGVVMAMSRAGLEVDWWEDPDGPLAANAGA
jgi:hypothetical protein